MNITDEVREAIDQGISDGLSNANRELNANLDRDALPGFGNAISLVRAALERVDDEAQPLAPRFARVFTGIAITGYASRAITRDFQAGFNQRALDSLADILEKIFNSWAHR